MEERFDLYDDQGRRLGTSKERSQVHRDGDWHRSIHLWIVRTDGSLVWQQRSTNKDTMPGLLTATVSGHYAAGEEVADVLREAVEEIGFEAPFPALLPLGQRRYEDTSSAPGLLDREWQDIFFWPEDVPLPELDPDPNEVYALLEMRAEDCISLFTGRQGAVDALRLLATPRRLDASVVTAADFVPTPRYHLQVAEAALLYASGGTPALHG